MNIILSLIVYVLYNCYFIYMYFNNFYIVLIYNEINSPMIRLYEDFNTYIQLPKDHALINLLTKD